MYLRVRAILLHPREGSRLLDGASRCGGEWRQIRLEGIERGEGARGLLHLRIELIAHQRANVGVAAVVAGAKQPLVDSLQHIIEPLLEALEVSMANMQDVPCRCYRSE